MKNFRDLLKTDSVFVFDGAMGTRLYDKGIYINRSYDELNIAAPDLVREVHEEYVAAGAVASVKRIFAFRRFGTDRVKIVDGGFREFNSAEMWLMPRGVTAPNPTPSVDNKFIKLLRRKSLMFDN